MRPKEVCERLGVSRRMLKQYEVRGLIYPIKLSSHTFRYDPEDVAALVESRRSSPECNQAPELQNGSC